MIYELHKITTFDGVEYVLNDHGARFVLSTPGEWGLPPITWQTSRSYKQDGLTEIGYQIDQRSFSVLFRHNGCSRTQFWQIRQNLLDICRPNRGGPVTYTIVLQDGDSYSIQARTLSPTFAEKGSDLWDEWGISELFRFDAFDPFWVKGRAISTTVTADPEDELTYPIAYDNDNIYYEDGSQFGSLAISYPGTIYSYPTITITAPFRRVRLFHQQLNKSITLLYNAATGSVIFDLANRTIETNTGTNLFNYLDSDSDLQAFRLEPDPEVANGLNTLLFFTPGFTAFTTISVNYAVRMVGI